MRPSSLLAAVAMSLAVFIRTACSTWRAVAGTGKSGFGGTTFRSLIHNFAVEMRLNSPWGLALDPRFNRLYVSEAVNSVVRSIDLKTGLMEIIAGTDFAGYSGDGGDAVSAQLNMPTGLALDELGRVLYVSDSLNHRVRAIALDPGRVYEAEVNVTLPEYDGVGLIATSEVHGPDVSASCPDTTSPSTPYQVSPLFMGSKFCDGTTGRGFVAFFDVIIEYIDFQVVATSGPGTYELRFRYADRYDRVHAAGDRRLRLWVNGAVLTSQLLFRPTGNVQTGLRNKYGWVSFSATLDRLKPQRNLVRLELAGYGGPRIDQLYVVPPRPIIWTVAGTGVEGPPGCRHGCLDDYPLVRDATTSLLHTPMGLALDSVGKVLYIADSDNGRVLRLQLAGALKGQISTIVGGARNSGTRDGVFSGALYGKLFRPVVLLLDSAKRYLYISDSEDHKVRRVDLTKPGVERVIMTVGGFGRQQAPFEYMLRSPHGLALDESTGTLYIADHDNGRVRSINIAPGSCPMQLVSRLRCGTEGVGELDCTSKLGCCWDPNCLDGFNPDARGPSAKPLDVLTKADQKASVPPISFIRSGSGFCCYPDLRKITTLDVLESPMGLLWDPRDRSLYVTQMKAHTVVKLVVTESQCAADALKC
mmetsp:Transcript_26606/g.70758  ORF Transcript_26606/g.70758 Transcript_26606/m.70758 type:complete len:643 (+) Transcript_26606:53-1981(+)